MKVVLLLASRSPRRRQLIRSLNIPVHCVESCYKERLARNIPKKPASLALHHAQQKTLGAIIPKAKNKEFLVLGADTIVVYRGQVLGKPASKKKAMQMLQLLAGRTHQVLTALALWNPHTGRKTTGLARTQVTFKKLDNTAILRYLETVHTLDKAGGYAIQEGPRIVKNIRGSRSNVIGLPMELLKSKLKQALKWYS